MTITNTFEREYNGCKLAVKVVEDKIVSARTFFGKKPIAYFDCATTNEPDGVAFNPKNYNAVWRMLVNSIDELLADEPVTEKDLVVA